MSAEIHFLGWDEPVTTKAVNYLIPKAPGVGPVNLSDLLVVVPTRQAGRRLREALARSCASMQTGLLPPRVEPPKFFLSGIQQQSVTASDTVVSAVWADTLMAASLSDYKGLFPAAPPSKDFDWALHTGEMLEHLRRRLVDGGYRIVDVLRRGPEVTAEPQRWRDLARLEAEYRKRLSKLGLIDPCEAMVEAAMSPELPEGVGRVVVAAVPDPALLALSALDKLAQTVPVACLVHAPESMRDHFGPWGRPLADPWQDVLLDIPGGNSNVRLAGSPAAQAEVVVETVGEEAERYGPADLTIGVPDASVVPALTARLEEEGFASFDPAGKPVSGHSVFYLLDAWRGLVNGGSYGDLADVIRHADMLDWFLRQGLQPDRLLQELDRFQNERLPTAWKDIERCFPESGGPDDGEALGSAVRLTRAYRQRLQTGAFPDSLRELLQDLYAGRVVRSTDAEGAAFAAVARKVANWLNDWQPGLMRRLRVTPGQALELLVRALSAESYYPDAPGEALELEGWLELPWNDAPFMVVTGMNEGSVPDGRIGDMFLPDSLLSALGLRNEADRYARDAHIMKSLIESRREGGRICCVAGKTSAAGEPQRPSRLLFRCPDTELPDRAARLFGSPKELHANVPATISFPLDPSAITPPELAPSRMSVTMFSSYLACPFRFYLKYVLGMEEQDDQKGELDALDFGILVHRAFQSMAENDEASTCTDVDWLSDFLWSEVYSLTTRRFGASLPLQVHIQLDTARQRLQAAARVQVEQVLEGWEAVEAEAKLEVEMEGITVVGKIDRIERHRDTGAIRVIDYKTSDRADRPDKAHIGTLRDHHPEYARVRVRNRDRAWTNLQLPLYRLLLSQRDDLADPFGVGYFNLPKAVTDTKIELWEGLDDNLMGSAETCARGVLCDLKTHRYWPPAESPAYDDFETLFLSESEECFDVKAWKDGKAQPLNP